MLIGKPYLGGDEIMFKEFYQSRVSKTVLDLGCNTGKNMERAQRFSGLTNDV